MNPERLFDTELILRNRLRALTAPQGSDFLMTVICTELSERLAAVERNFDIAVSLHAGNDTLAAALAGSGKTDKVVRMEQHSKMLLHDTTRAVGLVADLEAFPIAAESVDLAAAPLCLHLINDLPGILAQIAHGLRADGLMLAALPGAGTLSELRDALMSAEEELTGGVSPRVIPFADIRDCGALLQRAGFSLPVVDTETHTVRYDNMFALMWDLRNMGMANPLIARSRNPVPKSLFLRAADIYRERYSDPDGRIRASFNIVYLSGWKPHENQQKPLAPGSAKVRLADALGTHEQKP